MAVTIRRLEEFDEVENFDCGDAPLNSYLQRHAWTNQQKVSIGVTYVAREESAPRAVLLYAGNLQRSARAVSEEIRPRLASL